MRIYIGPYNESDDDRIINIHIDKYDTWNMDHTLALIIAPMLKQLRDTVQGAGYVDDEDVPEHLRSTAAPAKEDEYDIDDNHFLRWNWVLDEMIWAMENVIDSQHSSFYDHSDADKEEDINESIKKIKVDREGLAAYEQRIQNGCRLFGKYFRNLWD